MTQFSFTDELQTGNALIDGEHRELVRRINLLFDAMEAGASGDGLLKAMDALVAYAAEHFAHESAEMARIRYVAALAHESEHEKLMQQIVGLRDMVTAGGRINVPAVSDFLSEWLREHILSADRKLAAALRQERRAASAAHAG